MILTQDIINDVYVIKNGKEKNIVIIDFVGRASAASVVGWP